MLERVADHVDAGADPAAAYEWDEGAEGDVDSDVGRDAVRDARQAPSLGGGRS